MNRPSDHDDEQAQHNAIKNGRMPHGAEHSHKHDHQRERKDQNRDTSQEIRDGAGILVGVRRVRPKEAAAVGSQVLDGNDRRYWAAANRLVLHRVAGLLQYGYFCRSVERHRYAHCNQCDTNHQARGQKDIYDDAP